MAVNDRHQVEALQVLSKSGHQRGDVEPLFFRGPVPTESTISQRNVSENGIRDFHQICYYQWS